MTIYIIILDNFYHELFANFEVKVNDTRIFPLNFLTFSKTQWLKISHSSIFQQQFQMTLNK